MEWLKTALSHLLDRAIVVMQTQHLDNLETLVQAQEEPNHRLRRVHQTLVKILLSMKADLVVIQAVYLLEDQIIAIALQILVEETHLEVNLQMLKKNSNPFNNNSNAFDNNSNASKAEWAGKASSRRANDYGHNKSSNPFGQVSSNNDSLKNTFGNQVENRMRTQANVDRSFNQNCQYDYNQSSAEDNIIFQAMLEDPYGEGLNLNNKTTSCFPFKAQNHLGQQNQENINWFNNSPENRYEYPPENPLPVMKTP